MRKNIGFGLKLKKWKKGEIDDRVDEMLSLVQMKGLGDRTIDRISGGQQQRVALARALALEPKVLLLDEPLSNLDANLRVVMREEIRNIQERIGITTIFVTHDQYEAMSISDRLLVLNDGVIQQIGSPFEIYEKPENEFIAGFVGYVNFLEGTVDTIHDDTNIFVITTAYGVFEFDNDRYGIKVGDDVLVVIRPETVSLAPSNGTERPNTLQGIIQSQMYAGNLAKYTVKVGDREIIVDQYNPKDSLRFKNMEKVEIIIPQSAHILKRN